ncbi:MAG: DUF3047 domain-containing protein [Nitrospirota bacterium]
MIRTDSSGCFLSLLGVLLFVLSCTFSFAYSASDTRRVFLTFTGKTVRGIPVPWILREKMGKADVAVVQDRDTKILRLRADRSSFSLEHPLVLAPSDYPLMAWSWRVVKMPLRGDARRKDLNDQALQVLIAFENRKIISYIWDSNAPEGTVVDESLGWPFSVAVKVIVVRSGAADQNTWAGEQRNIFQDYRLLFQEDPPRLAGVRIQSNTQHTRDSAEGFVRDIIFSQDHTAVTRETSSSSLE